MEPAGHELFGGDTFRLSEHGKETLLPKKSLKQTPVDLDELTLAASITEKRLYYNSNDQAQIERLKSLLQPTSFSDIRLRMKQQGMRSGFACLLYGAPGTGKTETVLQIARAIGRNIMQVNLSELRSMWVGESEKKVKAVFDRYRNFVDYCDKEPILLFNEADGIIAKRSTNAVHAVDQMENITRKATVEHILTGQMPSLETLIVFCEEENIVENRPRIGF